MEKPRLVLLHIPAVDSPDVRTLVFSVNGIFRWERIVYFQVLLYLSFFFSVCVCVLFGFSMNLLLSFIIV